MEEIPSYRRRSPVPTPVLVQESSFLSTHTLEEDSLSSNEADETDLFLEKGLRTSSPLRRSSAASARARPWTLALLGSLIGSGLLLLLLRNERVHSTIVDAIMSPSASSLKLEACGMCASSADTCSKYGIEAMQLTRAYQGSGRRIKRVLSKARRGEKITIGILGGSVSEGIGVPANKRWHEVVQTWFNETFTGEVELVNGAVPGRGTEYFMSCHGEHITKEADIVIIELGINDWHSGSLYSTDMETLVRALLNYPNKPAIMFAESFALTLPHLSTGTDAHIGVAQYYDIPVISLRNWLLPELLFNPSVKDAYFFGDRDGSGKHLDYLHIGPPVHEALGNLINAVLEQQLCLLQHGPPPSSPRNIDDPWPNHYNAHYANRIPRLRMIDPWSDTDVVPVPNSNCRSLNSPHIESQLTFDAERSTGWYKWDDDIPWRNVKTYLRGDNAGDRIVFPGIDMVDGTWTFYYLRSNKKNLGNARCWVDDLQDQAIYVEGWWERKMDVGEVLPMHKGLSMGPHDITCEIDEKTNDPEGGHTFLVIALMWACASQIIVARRHHLK